MRRGELYRVRGLSGDVKRSRVVVVVSRQALIDSSFSTVLCAPVYSGERGLETEVSVGVGEGLKHPSVVLCDGLTSVPKRLLTDFVGELGPRGLEQLGRALRVALDVE